VLNNALEEFSSRQHSDTTIVDGGNDKRMKFREKLRRNFQNGSYQLADDVQKWLFCSRELETIVVEVRPVAHDLEEWGGQEIEFQEIETIIFQNWSGDRNYCKIDQEIEKALGRDPQGARLG